MQEVNAPNRRAGVRAVEVPAIQGAKCAGEALPAKGRSINGSKRGSQTGAPFRMRSISEE